MIGRSAGSGVLRLPIAGRTGSRVARPREVSPLTALTSRAAVPCNTSMACGSCRAESSGGTCGAAQSRTPERCPSGPGTAVT